MQSGLAVTAPDVTEEESILLCYYCEAGLDLEFDYTCIICGALTCDNHNDVCQVDYED